MSTPIADMVEQMMARGVPPDVIVLAVKTAELTTIPIGNPVEIPVDRAAENRRAYDRERYRLRRKSTGKPPDSAVIPISPLTTEDLKIDSKNSKRRGERIPTEWKPAAGDIAFALAKGLLAVRLETEAEKFRNYWTAKSGAAATKVDWSATWRNWVLTSLERSGTPMPTAPPPLDAKPAWAIPPWERDGISEKAWKERELGKTNGAAVRRDS